MPRISGEENSVLRNYISFIAWKGINNNENIIFQCGNLVGNYSLLVGNKIRNGETRKINRILVWKPTGKLSDRNPKR
jgi:hypothetical protein